MLINVWLFSWYRWKTPLYSHKVGGGRETSYCVSKAGMLPPPPSKVKTLHFSCFYHLHALSAFLLFFRVEVWTADACSSSPLLVGNSFHLRGGPNPRSPRPQRPLQTISVSFLLFLVLSKQIEAQCTRVYAALQRQGWLCILPLRPP